jgi:hypothetical protein
MAQHKTIDRRAAMQKTAPTPAANAGREHKVIDRRQAGQKQTVSQPTVPAQGQSARVGSYYSPREYGAQTGSYEDRVTAARAEMEQRSEAMRQAQRALEQLNAQVEERRNRYQELTGTFEGDTAAEYEKRILDDWTEAVDLYDEGRQKWEQEYAAYKPYEDAYNAALGEYNAYVSAERAEYDRWRGSIRGAEEIRAEQSQIKSKRAELQRLMQEQNAIASGTAAPGIQAKAAQNEQRIAQLQEYLGGVGDREGLLKEELDWSEHFRFEDLRGNADFGEMSAYRSGIGGVYDQVNTRSGAYSSDLFRDDAFAGIYWRMTDEEAAMHNYLHATRGEEAAREYLAYLTPELNRRKTEEATGAIREWSGRNPVNAALATAGSVLLSPLSGIEGAAGMIAAKIRGEEIDPNAAYAQAGNWKNAAREGVTETIEENLGTFWGPVGSFAYQTGVSMMDMLADSVAGPAAMALIGTRAFSEGTMEAKGRGLDDTQALAMGATAGAAEVLTERIGLDELLHLPDEWADAGFWKGLLRGAAGEAAEEGLTNLANLAADLSIAGEKSEFMQSVHAYREQGMDDQKAVLKALGDAGISLALDALGGAISGGVFGGWRGYQGKKAAAQVQQKKEGAAQAQQEEAPSVSEADSSPIPDGTGEPLGDGTQAVPYERNAAPNSGTKASDNGTKASDNGTKTVAGERVGASLEELKAAAVNRRNPLVSGVMQTAEDEELVRRIQKADTKTEVTALNYGVSDEKLREALRIRELTGKEIVFEPEGKEYLGFYDPAADEIHLAADTGDIMAATFGHELTHSIERTAQWESLRNLVAQRMNETGVSWETARRHRQELYAKAGHAVADDKRADREVVAHYVEKHLLTDEQAIRALVKDDRSIARRILDWLDGLWAKVAKTKGAKEREFVRKAREIYRSALQEAGERTARKDVREAMHQAWAEGDEATADAMFEELYGREQGALLEELEDYDPADDRDLAFSFAGENANNADLEALARAKEMQAAGVAEETIRQQTGWHIGMDGKWRWEIDDSGMEYTSRGDLGFRERNPGYARYRELLDKANRHALELSDEALTEAERAELNRLSNIWRGTFRKPGRITEDALPQDRLGDYIRHDELFEAYPQLRKTRLRFQELRDGTRGQYDPERDVITLSEGLRGKPQETLIHEIQHVIQKAEGFAQGSSPEFWEQVQKGEQPIRTNDRRVAEAERKIQEILDSLPPFVAGQFNLHRHLEKSDPDKAMELADDLSEGPYGDKFSDFFLLTWDLDMAAAEENSIRGAGDLYRNTAGEIEARDAAARRKLTAEQRRSTEPARADDKTVFVEDMEGLSLRLGDRYSVDDTDSQDNALSQEQQEFFDAEYMAAVEQGDMAAAQQMVDEAAEHWGAYLNNDEANEVFPQDGKVRVFYHGTNNGEFTKFDGRLLGNASGDLGWFGKGFYFAFDRREAATYGGRVIPAYLQIRKPYDYSQLYKFEGSDKGASEYSRFAWVYNVVKQFPDIVQDQKVWMYPNGAEQGISISWKQLAGRMDRIRRNKEFTVEKVELSDGSTAWELRADPKKESWTNPDGETFEWTKYGMRRTFATEQDALEPINQIGAYLEEKLGVEPIKRNVIEKIDFSGAVQRAGYDGIVQSMYGDEAVIFAPEQIKSAEPVTYDDNGEVVPLSKRFDFKNPDIRYSIREPGSYEYSDEELAEIDELARRGYMEEDAKGRKEWAPVEREALTGRAKEHLGQVERKLTAHVAAALDVPRQASRDFLKPIVTELADEYMKQGTISPEVRDRLFDTAWEQGRVVDQEFYDTYKEVKDHLRTTAVTISETDRDSRDWEEFRKSAFGTLKIVNEGGTPVDVLWQELQEMAPALFPDDILNPEDQLRHMYEVGQSIRKVEKTLDEHYGSDAAMAKQMTRNDFDAAVADCIHGLWEVKRHADDLREERTAIADEKGAELTVREVAALYPKLKDVRRELEKAMAKNLLNKQDKNQVQRLLRHDIQPEHLDPKVDNVRGILAVYEAKKAFEEVAEPIRKWNRQRKARLYAEAEELVYEAEMAGGIKDKSKGFLYSRETMERNIRDIVKNPEHADRIVDTYFKPVHQAEAAATRMKNQYRERVKALDISRKVRKGDTVSEAYAVQFYGEVSDILRMMEQSKFRLKQRDGKSYKEWKAELQKLWEENPSLDKAKIENAAREMGKIYEELFEQMNQARVENGYEPINHRSGYFPHFQQDGRDGILSQFGKAMGIDVEVQQLPTSINGMTHTFKPGIRWFGNALERKTFDTAYDAVEGFDRYIEGCAGVVHQTANIQRLRALANQIRYRTGDEGLREQIRKIQAREDLTDEQKDTLIRETASEGKFQLSNFVVELDEYANLLANKKSRADRNMEQAMGRDMYNIVKGLESRVAANMVAINPGSWLTNFIPITQGWVALDTRYWLTGMGQTIRAVRTDDGMVDMSDFLTNRVGSDALVQTTAQKVSGVLSSPMEWIDGFTAGSLVRARYAQNVAQGMSKAEAMSEADEWTAGVMADRSKGAMPTVFHRSNPLTKVFTQFQLEVNNQLGYMFKDIPREKRKKGVLAVAAALLKLALGAWLYNELYEKFLGRRPALDPIDMAFGFVTDWADPELDFADAAMGLGEKIAENTPFVGGLLGGGRVPISSALPNAENLLKAVGNKEWSGKKRIATAAKELAKPVVYMLPPFGGGQIKKIWEGLKMIRQGGSYTVDANGNPMLQYTLYSTDNAVQKALEAGQAMIFGKTTIRSGREWVEGGFKTLSAEQTATYQALIAMDVEQADAFELLTGLRSAEKEGDKPRTAVQRDILRASGLEGDTLATVYYDLMVEDGSKEKALLESLQSSGADMGKVASCLMDMKDADLLDGAAGSNAMRDALRASGLTDGQKQEIYHSRISDSRDDDIEAFRSAGMDMDDFLEVQNQYTAIKESYEDEGDMATAFARWVNGQSYTAEQKSTVRDCFKYWNMFPANADRYDKAIAAGLDDDEAFELAEELKDLGKNPKDVQKWRVGIDNAWAPENQLQQLKAVGMDDAAYAKCEALWDAGVAPAAYVRAQEIKSQFDSDGNGSLTNEDWRNLINSMVPTGIVLPGDNERFNMTSEQMGFLWQMLTGNKSTKNNPFSKTGGEKWLAIKNAGK